jgi:hypothetical protein
MPGDFVTDDLDTIMVATELATDASWTPAGGAATAIVGMYDAGFIDIDPVTGETSNVDPQFIVKKTDVTGIKQGDAIVIDSVSYIVKNPIPSESDDVMIIKISQVRT